jgi:hypothetical protein
MYVMTTMAANKNKLFLFDIFVLFPIKFTGVVQSKAQFFKKDFKI